jgi:hypothetical protein
MDESLIYGNWLYQDERLNIEIGINRKKVTIFFHENGKGYSETFKSDNYRWFRESAIPLDHSQYFFDKVDEEHLHFGKFGK